jgi:hypothetical protein
VHQVFSDMELDRKFEIATSCRSVTLGSLEPDQQYPIVHAERINTRYGQSVLLAILDSPTTSIKVFMPKRYGDVVSEEDLRVINSKRMILYLIYKGTCP